MKPFTSRILFVTLLLLIYTTSVAQEAKPITWKDVPAWKSIYPFSVTVSPDGQWVAYSLLPVDGDGELIVQKVRGTDKKSYAIGSTTNASDRKSVV